MDPAAPPRTSLFVRRLLALTPEERRGYLDTLPKTTRDALRYAWQLWARPEQWWEPGPETWTVILAGRGWGKNETLAHTAHRVAARPDWCAGWIGIAGRTWGDVYGTILEGDVGILTKAPPGWLPRLNQQKRKIVWPNGVVGRLFSGEEPDSFRGPNVGFLLADELAFWAELEASWQNAKLITRRGRHARGLITTTPLPHHVIEELVWALDEAGEPIVAAPGEPEHQGYRIAQGVRVITGSTYDNRANLAENYIRDVIDPLSSSDVGDQEVRAQILRAATSSPWKPRHLRRIEEIPEALVERAIVIDPAAKLSGSSAEVGIVDVGLGASGRLYLVADLSGAYGADEWPGIVAARLVETGANTIVAEDNQGGDMIDRVLRDAMPRTLAASVVIHRVTASVSKSERAAIAAVAWSAGRVYHVGHAREWIKLERQLLRFDPARPKAGPTDRMDAAGWAALWYFGDGTDRAGLESLGDPEFWARVLSSRKAAARAGRARSRRRR